jgi:hypothetical protein
MRRNDGVDAVLVFFLITSSARSHQSPRRPMRARPIDLLVGQCHEVARVPLGQRRHEQRRICHGHGGHRFDDIGVLRMARAYEAMRPAQREWPEA